jgi:hypothetical protein
MGKHGLAAWALANGRVADDQPSSPGEAIVRMALKATVVNLEVRKPAGKWRKVSGAAYGKIQPDPDAGLPLGPGPDTIPGFTMLMRQNKDRMVFAGMTGPPETLADGRCSSPSPGQPRTGAGAKGAGLLSGRCPVRC